MPMAGLTVTPLTSVIGARIDGVAVARATDDEIGAIRAAVLEHGVVFLPGQDLSDEEQLAFASRFGPVSTFPLQRLFGGSGPSISNIEDTADSPPDADGWHTDVTWIQEPPAMAFLNARI